MEFSLKESHLQAIQKWDGLSYGIYPEVENKFFNTDDGATFIFEKDDTGAVIEVNIDVGYQKYKLSRIH